MLIKIIAGVFGHRVDTRVVPVKAGDDPIEVADAIAERLIKKGVAELVVDEPKAEQETDNDEGEGLEPFPAYNENMTREELNKIAESVGIEAEVIEATKTKGDLIGLLDEVKAEYEADEAPSFDPEGDML